MKVRLLIALFVIASFQPLVTAGEVFTYQADMSSATEPQFLTPALVKYTVSALPGNKTSVQFDVTNTADASLGGGITGVAFQLPAGVVFDSMYLTLPGWGPDFSPNTSPFTGDYDLAYALGSNFAGGGSPAGGIAPGQTKSFGILLNGTVPTALFQASFLGGGGRASGTVLRERGFTGGGSQKVGVTTIPVPEPRPYILGGLVVLLLAAHRASKVTYHI